MHAGLGNSKGESQPDPIPDADVNLPDLPSVPTTPSNKTHSTITDEPLVEDGMQRAPCT